jgi:ubiquinone/menaquinone biosynthesis C-methylase UbiE
MSKTAPTEPKYEFTRTEYAAKINTPSQSPEYFSQFLLPVIQHGIQSARAEGRKAQVLDVGCGHAHQLTHLSGHAEREEVDITGLDISPTALQAAREHITANHPEISAKFQEGDVESDTVFAPNSFDGAFGVNAMAYKPAHFLKTLANALKPGARACLNFFIPEKNPAYIEYYRERGCIITDSMLEVETAAGVQTYKTIITDFSQYRDPNMQKLGKQMFFQSIEEVHRLVQSLGLEVKRQGKYEFASVANPRMDNDVLTLEKVNTPEIANIQQTVKERFLEIQ